MQRPELDCDNPTPVFYFVAGRDIAHPLKKAISECPFIDKYTWNNASIKYTFKVRKQRGSI